jgi:uncharacterized OB-fold protein
MNENEKRYHESCVGKNVYKNGDTAERAAYWIFRKAPERGEVHAYRCPHCGRWHVGPLK